MVDEAIAILQQRIKDTAAQPSQSRVPGKLIVRTSARLATAARRAGLGQSGAPDHTLV